MDIVSQLIEVGQKIIKDINRSLLLIDPKDNIETLDKCRELQRQIRMAEKQCEKKRKYITDEKELKSCEELVKYMEKFKKNGAMIEDECLKTSPMLTVKTVALLYGVNLVWERYNLVTRFQPFYLAVKNKDMFAFKITGPNYFSDHSFIVIYDRDSKISHDLYIFIQSFAYDEDIYITTLNYSEMVVMMGDYNYFLSTGQLEYWKKLSAERDVMIKMYPDIIDPSKLSGHIGIPTVLPERSILSIIKNAARQLDKGMDCVYNISRTDPLQSERMSLLDVVNGRLEQQNKSGK